VPLSLKFNVLTGSSSITKYAQRPLLRKITFGWQLFLASVQKY